MFHSEDVVPAHVTFIHWQPLASCDGGGHGSQRIGSGKYFSLDGT